MADFLAQVLQHLEEHLGRPLWLVIACADELPGGCLEICATLQGHEDSVWAWPSGTPALLPPRHARAG